MAIARVQVRSNAIDAAASIALAYSSNVTAGSLLVCVGSTFNTTLTISDSKSQSWTRDLSGIAATDAGGCMGHFANAASGATTVTVTRASGSDDVSISIGEYSGVDTAGTQDGTAATNGNSLSSASLTTTDAGSVVLSGLWEDGFSGTASVTNSFAVATQSTFSATKMNVALAERLPGATGSYSTTWSASGGVNAAAMVGIIAFKPDAGGGGGGGTTRLLASLGVGV